MHDALMEHIHTHMGTRTHDAPQDTRHKSQDTLACMHPATPPPYTPTDLGRGTNHRLSFPGGAWHAWHVDARSQTIEPYYKVYFNGYGYGESQVAPWQRQLNPGKTHYLSASDGATLGECM